MLSEIGHKIYNEIQGDKAIWLIFGLLAIISALAVYSATGSMAIQHETNPVMYLLKHFKNFLDTWYTKNQDVSCDFDEILRTDTLASKSVRITDPSL